MMRILFALAAISISATPAFARPCADLSGFYVDQDVTFLFDQSGPTGCESLVVKATGPGISQVTQYPLDGHFRKAQAQISGDGYQMSEYTIDFEGLHGQTVMVSGASGSSYRTLITKDFLGNVVIEDKYIDEDGILSNVKTTVLHLQR
jgi:hypothetical protein